MIQFDDVSKRYPSGQEALSHIDFRLARGELAFLTGHSGAGKSTLLKLIMLMELPSSGQVIINGQNLGKVSRKALPYYRRNIGLVFQDHQLLFDRTVYDNVALPLQIAGLVASVANLLDLRVAVVAGSVALGYGDAFFDAASVEADRCAQLDFSRGVRIVPTGCGEDGPVVGAAAVGLRGIGRLQDGTTPALP